MSSVIPTRRTTRSTRTATHKDPENATARQLRNNRAKPPSSSTLAPAAGPIRVAAQSGAPSRAKTSGHALDDPIPVKQTISEALPVKRKREALGELTSRTAQNKPKVARGKEKAAPARASSTTSSTRESRTTHHTTTLVSKRNELPDVKEENETLKVAAGDSAMAIDHPLAIPSLRRSLTKTGNGAPALRSVDNVDVDDARVFKKRRTSEDPPEEFLTAFDDEEQVDEEAEAEARLNAEMEAYANEPEADAKNSAWTDLDIDDGDDASMVSEYVLEIFDYLKEVEQTTMPNPKYMESQKELGWKMRGILSDWLIDVHVRFRLLPETLFLCINLVDRFLSTRVISLAKLQLVGVTCLFIAAKSEEMVVPSIEYFVKCAETAYTGDDMLKAERYILQIINWNLSYPSPVHFVRRISKADDYNVPVRTIAKYLIEVALVEWRLIAVPPSLLAAAAMWLSRLMLGYETWTPNLAHYSSYSESELLPTANLMLNYLLKPITHKSFFKKYGGKRYNKASVRLYEWTRERWLEGSKVNLQADLPRLKAHVRIERADEDAREAELRREHCTKDLTVPQ